MRVKEPQYRLPCKKRKIGRALEQSRRCQFASIDSDIVDLWENHRDRVSPDDKRSGSGVFGDECYSWNEDVVAGGGLKVSARKIPPPKSLEFVGRQDQQAAAVLILQKSWQGAFAASLPRRNKVFAAIAVVRHAADLWIADGPVEMANENRQFFLGF